MLETLSLDLGPKGHINRLWIVLPYHNAGGHRGLFKVIMRLRFFNHFHCIFEPLPSVSSLNKSLAKNFLGA
jgi:hypothetical protein